MSVQGVTQKIEEKEQRKLKRLKLRDNEIRRKFWSRVTYIIKINKLILLNLPIQMYDISVIKTKSAAEKLIKYHVIKYHAKLKAGEFTYFEKIIKSFEFNRMRKLFSILVNKFCLI